MNELERSNELEHYGRLGMKWYQHIFGEYQDHAKYSKKVAKPTVKEKIKKSRQESKEAKANKKASKEAINPKGRKDPSTMSEQELKSALKRLQQENNYHRELEFHDKITSKKYLDKLETVVDNAEMFLYLTHATDPFAGSRPEVKIAKDVVKVAKTFINVNKYQSMNKKKK